MKAIRVDTDGGVAMFEGPEDFWMNGDVVWAEGPYPNEPDHTVYYDDEAFFSESQVRTTLSGLDYPLPIWIMGVSGENTVDVALSVEKVAEDLGSRRVLSVAQ